MDDVKPVKSVIVMGPTQPVAFSIYRITFGEYVYIGHTRDIHNRAYRHATDKRRKIGILFSCDSCCSMLVEHLEGASTKCQAQDLEREHIQREQERVGDKLLNTHHARPKKK